MTAALPRLRLVLVVGFVLLHAALLSSTTLHVRLWKPDGGVGAAIRDYEALTGADNTFSFFAPHVASQAFTEVTTFDVSGATRTWLYDRPQTEGDLRLVAYSLSMQQQGLYDLLAYSLATRALRRDPAAASVAVRLGFYKTPKLADSRALQFPQILYTGKYERAEDRE